ncbi:MAG: MBL fold metallo-hydrolase [Oscillospiraceae bacterium]|nr:MBL fold metallo-hydrolase [Oscillospiraceae bacterium]
MQKKTGKRLCALLLAAALLVVLCGCGEIAPRPEQETSAELSSAPLSVYFFDAGKADAILLSTPDAAVLIDCGEKGFGGTITDELAARGIEKLDLLIITHFDRDHVGGAAKVIGSVEIGKVLQSNCPKDSREYRKYNRALDKAAIEPLTVRETLSFEFDGVAITVDPPREETYEENASNNSSLIVTVTLGSQTLLFLGDAESARIAEYLADAPVDCTLLKVPHHGGKEPMTEALLRAVKPAYAVITCSDAEHESASTTAALRSCGAEIFLTRLGPVSVRCDGETIEVFYDRS